MDETSTKFFSQIDSKVQVSWGHVQQCHISRQATQNDLRVFHTHLKPVRRKTLAIEKELCF